MSQKHTQVASLFLPAALRFIDAWSAFCLVSSLLRNTCVVPTYLLLQTINRHSCRCLFGIFVNSITGAMYPLNNFRDDQSMTSLGSSIPTSLLSPLLNLSQSNSLMLYYFIHKYHHLYVALRDKTLKNTGTIPLSKSEQYFLFKIFKI